MACLSKNLVVGDCIWYPFISLYLRLNTNGLIIVENNESLTTFNCPSDAQPAMGRLYTSLEFSKGTCALFGLYCVDSVLILHQDWIVFDTLIRLTFTSVRLQRSWKIYILCCLLWDLLFCQTNSRSLAWWGVGSLLNNLYGFGFRKRLPSFDDIFSAHYGTSISW